MKRILPVFLFITVVYLNNASSLRPVSSGEPSFLAHRGVHQNFSKEGITSQSCTATRIQKPTHSYLENTIASIEEAFSLGAKIVEIDIHPTRDGRFVVFHDWTVDCRTNGQGVTREQSLAYLQSLDIGYGYTPDDGDTYPFRGLGIRKMPSLEQVLDGFPGRRFLINIKSNDPAEADLILSFLSSRRPEDVARLMFYGGVRPTNRLISKNKSIKGFTNQSIKRCAIQYQLVGWTGYVPESCRDTVIALPLDYSSYFWGWPTILVNRLQRANTELILIGMSQGVTDGIDDPAQIKHLYQNYRGIIWTDEIEKIGPHVR